MQVYDRNAGFEDISKGGLTIVRSGRMCLLCRLTCNLVPLRKLFRDEKVCLMKNLFLYDRGNEILILSSNADRSGGVVLGANSKISTMGDYEQPHRSAGSRNHTSMDIDLRYFP